jgi:hypothetical protein
MRAYNKIARLSWVYDNMMRRCYLPTNKAFKYYGGRGIKVCQEWIDDRKAFYLWAVDRWQPGLQLDREDNDSGYSPANCRFVTPTVNNHNKRPTVRKFNTVDIGIKYQNGVPISRIAREASVSRPTVYGVLVKIGLYSYKLKAAGQTFRNAGS